MARPACFLCLCQAMRVLASKLMFCTSVQPRSPGGPIMWSTRRYPVTTHKRLSGCRARRITGVVGNGSGGRGRPEVLSQLVLHVSYVFQPSHRIDLPVWNTRESNRIDSGDRRVESAAYAGSHVDALVC